MAKYIEKQAALDIVNGWRNQLIPTYGENDEYVKCLETVAEHLESLHAADVRPVVLCGDCRWFDVTGFPDKDLYMPELRMGYCRSLGRDVQACWFCGTGEQKEDANSLMEAIERNTTKIVEKSNELLAEYIRHLQEKNKALDEELASLRETFLQATRGGRVDADEKD